jgi:hypothetical protein
MSTPTTKTNLSTTTKAALAGLLFFSLALSACQQSSPKKENIKYLKEANQYSIVLHLKIKLPGNSFKNHDRTIAIASENDSTAYWQGVKRYVGLLKTDKSLTGKGITPPFLIDSFTVYNKEKENILANLPASVLNKAESYMKKEKNSN